jgi:hypothetical protein
MKQMIFRADSTRDTPKEREECNHFGDSYVSLAYFVWMAGIIERILRGRVNFARNGLYAFFFTREPSVRLRQPTVRFQDLPPDGNAFPNKILTPLARNEIAVLCGNAPCLHENLAGELGSISAVK